MNDKLELLEKLREKYKQAAETHSKQFFNLIDLETRITHLLKTSGDVLAFLESEKNMFESIMTKVEHKKQEEIDRQEMHSRMNEILAANEEKIQKYSDIMFDPHASVEIRRLVGAITEFTDKYSAILKNSFGGSLESNDLFAVMADLDRFYMPEDASATVLLKHYVEELKMKGEDGREAIDRKIMQTGGLLLYKLTRAIGTIVDSLPEKHLQQKLNFPGQGKLDLKEAWQGKTAGQLAADVKQQSQLIIDDFRIGDLVEHAYRQGG